MTPPALTLKAAAARDGLTLTIGCPAGESACIGTVKLTTTTSVKVGKGRRARTKTRTIVVGQASFSLTGGQSKAVLVKLNGSGRSLLKARRSLKLAVAIAVRDAAGNATTGKLSATVKAAKPRRAKKKR